GKWKKEGKCEGGDDGDAAELCCVLARDAIAHLLHEIVLAGVRGLEEPHAAEPAEAGRSSGVALARRAVDETPVSQLQGRRERNREQCRDRQKVIDDAEPR